MCVCFSMCSTFISACILLPVFHELDSAIPSIRHARHHFCADVLVLWSQLIFCTYHKLLDVPKMSTFWNCWMCKFYFQQARCPLCVCSSCCCMLKTVWVSVITYCTVGTCGMFCYHVNFRVMVNKWGLTVRIIYHRM